MVLIFVLMGSKISTMIERVRAKASKDTDFSTCFVNYLY
jgi:hypothetical protein